MDFILLTLPWILLIGWTLYSMKICLNYEQNLTAKWTNFYVFESIPQIFITLGLLGTFAGITHGLIHFDTSPDLIKESIKELLDGLKVAFYTTLAGIVGHLIFGKIVKYKINAGHAEEPEFKQELLEFRKMNEHLEHLSDNLSESIDNAIVESFKGVIEDVNQTFKLFIDQLVSENFDRLTNSIDQLTAWQKNYREEIIVIRNSYVSLVERHQRFVELTQTWVNTLDEIAGQRSKLSTIVDDFKAITDDDARFSKIIYEVKESIENMKGMSEALVEHSNELEEVKSAFKDARNEVSIWLNREDGVRDAANALSNSLKELKSFEITEIKKLDESFMIRLGNTFNGLDSLLKEYVVYLENKSTQ